MRSYSAVGIIVLVLYILIGALSTPTLQQYVDTHHDHLLWTTRDKVLAEADNGDIILWSTNTKIIQYASNSPFTHISLVFRDYEKPRSGKKCLYCWEADLGQQYRSGPRIIRLRDKFARYKGAPIVGWKPLARGRRPTSRHLLKIIAPFSDYRMDIYAIRWCLSRVLAATPCGGGVWQKFLSSSLFNHVVCSELVAETLQQVGILRPEPPASQYAPGDWLNNNLSLDPRSDYGPTFFFHSKKV